MPAEVKPHGALLRWSSSAQDGNGHDAHKRAEHGTEYKSGGEDQEPNSVFGATSLEKYWFNKLEELVSEKAHPGQVDHHCSGETCYRPNSTKERNWFGNEGSL